MANLARMGSQNPTVQRLAHELSQVDLESYLRSVFRYRDEIEEIVRTPEFMAEDLATLGIVEGDCDDIAVFVAALTKAERYPVRLTAIQAESPKEYDHVFPEIQTDAGWQPIDITVSPDTVYSSYAFMSEWV